MTERARSAPTATTATTATTDGAGAGGADMKALSTQQPWAWLIVHGYKDTENRTWATSRRGETLIHAGKTFDRDGYDWVRATFPEIPMPLPQEFERGGIVGLASLRDCVTQSASRWFFGPHGFVFADASPLPFTPVRGMLGFFPCAVPTQSTEARGGLPEQVPALTPAEWRSHIEVVSEARQVLSASSVDARSAR